MTRTEIQNRNLTIQIIPYATMVERKHEREESPSEGGGGGFVEVSESRRVRGAGNLDLKCTVCGKACLDSSNRRRHMRSHSGDRPFPYTTCGKAFKQSNHLTTHKRTHSGDCPYVCTTCSKAFSDSSNLTRHLSTHSGALLRLHRPWHHLLNFRPPDDTHAHPHRRPPLPLRHLRQGLLDVQHPDETLGRGARTRTGVNVGNMASSLSLL